MNAKDDPKLNNIEAEQAVLGALLIDKDAIIFIREMLSPADFFIDRHSTIYSVIMDLHDLGKPIDFVLVTDELERRGELVNLGGASFVAGLMRATPTSAHVEHHAGIIKKQSVFRQLLGASGEIARIAYSELATVDEAMQDAQTALFNISRANLTHRPRPVKEFCEAAYDQLEAIRAGRSGNGLSTGLVDLDRLLGGLRPGELSILAGRPGMGKSSLGMQMATHNVRAGASVLYFSREMPGLQLTNRIIAGETKINNKRLKSTNLQPEEYQKIYKAMAVMEDWDLLIDDRTATIEGIRTRAMLQAARRLDLIVVDYIQRIATNKNYQNRDSEIGRVSEVLKNLAIELGVPILVISSLNRQCESRADKRPMLADLRESGNLEYDSDNVLFIYRDEVYYSDSQFPGLAEISIAKQRDGETGMVQVLFRKEFTKFDSLVRDTVQMVGI